MKNMNKKFLIIIIIGIAAGLLFFFEVKPILVSQGEAIDIALKTDNCEKHSWQLASAEAHLYHYTNGVEYTVDPQTKRELPTYVGSNKFEFGYEWQVIITCHANGMEPEIIQWIDAFTG